MNWPAFNHNNNLYIPAGKAVKSDFEELYVLVRLKEEQIYTDEELFRLPEVEPSHRHFHTWMIRKHSCRELVNRLEAKNKILNILEIGCGNGWLSYQLSRIPGSRVIGMDINLTELRQASRVFNSNSKLKFIYGDIRSGLVNDMKFDVIILAASIEYFPNIREIVDFSMEQLFPDGEIHIIDSPIYRRKQKIIALQKAKEYFKNIGYPGMVSYYHPHCISEFSGLDYHKLRDPGSLNNIFFGRNPYYWICIKNNKFLN